MTNRIMLAHNGRQSAVLDAQHARRSPDISQRLNHCVIERCEWQVAVASHLFSRHVCNRKQTKPPQRPGGADELVQSERVWFRFQLSPLCAIRILLDEALVEPRAD